MRRRADLAFMVQMYELAYTSYHTAKGDFGNDQAWMHYAGSLVGMQFSDKAIVKSIVFVDLNEFSSISQKLAFLLQIKKY